MRTRLRHDLSRAPARELSLDLCRSWMVGDAESDLLAGRNAGCLGSILTACPAVIYTIVGENVRIGRAVSPQATTSSVRAPTR